MDARRVRRRAENEPGHAHELSFSCHRRYRFLQAEQVCLWIAEAIDAAWARLDFGPEANVVMPEHVHLLVAPGKRDAAGFPLAPGETKAAA